MSDWNARRILKELVDGDRRRAVLAELWRHGDSNTKQAALGFLAKALSFREVTLRKLTPERKAELLAARLATPDSEPYLEEALMQHHMHQANALMGAFLDRWGIAHDNGAIANDAEVAAPDLAQVRSAVSELAGTYDRAEVRLYLATAGLLMGPAWRESTWTVVDEMAG